MSTSSGLKLGAQMRMHGRIWIDHTSPEVYAFVATPSNDPLWREQVQVMTADRPGPVVNGMQTYEVLTFLGTTYTTSCLICEHQASHSYQFRSIEAANAVWGLRKVEAVDGGTLVSSVLHINVSGFARIAVRPLRWLYQRRLNRDLQRLKRVLEAQRDGKS